MPKVFVNGVNMFYKTIGEGYPLVGIMGLGGNMDWWFDSFQDEISKHYKFIMLDNRGSGRTDSPLQSAYTIPEMAKDTVLMLESIGIKDFYLFGLSMGGMIAQQIALDYPERVKKLVLGCTYCGGKNAAPAPPEMQKALENRDREATSDDTVKLLFPAEYIKNNPELIGLFKQRISIIPTTKESFERQVGGIMLFDTFDRLKNINIPTLIMTGDQDYMISPENSKILYKAIPNSKYVMFEKTGHGFLMQEEKKVIETLKEFLG